MPDYAVRWIINVDLCNLRPILVGGKMIVDIKAARGLAEAHEARLLN